MNPVSSFDSGGRTVSDPSPTAINPKMWGLALGTLALGLLLARVVTNLAGAGEGPDGAARRAEAIDDGVRVRGWLDRGRVVVGGEVTLWVSIENSATLPLSDPRIASVNIPGFDPIGPCWTARGPGSDRVPACAVGERRPAGLTPLAPGQVATRWGALQATGAQETGMITVIFDWSRVVDASPVTDQGQAVLTLGPIEVDATPVWWRIVLASTYEFFKDLGLPITLGLLAYLFQRLQGDREERFLRHQQESDHIHQVRQILLPRAHENAVRYLMPMSMAEARAAASAKAFSAATDTKKRQEHLLTTFYYLANLLRRNHELLNHGGGVFLDGRLGENLAIDCWSAIFDRIALRLTRLFSAVCDRRPGRGFRHFGPIRTEVPPTGVPNRSRSAFRRGDGSGGEVARGTWVQRLQRAPRTPCADHGSRSEPTLLVVVRSRRSP
jgi:hypothetical protein